MTDNTSPATKEEVAWYAQQFARLLQNVEYVIKGKREKVAQALICLLAEGHLLLEDVPGTGKTSLAKALATSVGGTWSRVQFTPDMLPSDVTGVMIFNQQTQQFEFHDGPVFANVVLGDEINRASPKTQSALLEVMEEHQVTIDGDSHAVPRPFVVIATQNPVEQAGTYPLPEAQLDRFLMRTTLGYPNLADEIEVLRGDVANVQLAEAVSVDQINEMVNIAKRVHVEDSIYDYVVRLADATRNHDKVRLGVSPRGSVGLVRAARASAAAQSREFVTADDIKLIAESVMSHRLLLKPQAELDGIKPEELINEILDSPDVRPPTVD